MIWTILKVLVSMYLAGVVLNVIILVKTYKNLENDRMGFSGILYGFFTMLTNPRMTLHGTIKAIKNWNWLEGKIGKDASGNFIVINKEE